MWEPCDFCGNFPMFTRGTLCGQCGYPGCGEAQDFSKILCSEIRKYWEPGAKVRSPPSNSSLAKKMIDFEDMNKAPSMKSEIDLFCEPGAEVRSPPSNSSPEKR
ncbi:hypothetical protein DsansV1_C13g0117561 [Dioscorea sansibarensis]